VHPDEEARVSVRDENIRDDSTSFEVERHTDDQPPRDDIIEPDDLDASEIADELEGSPDATGLDVGANRVDDPDPFHRDDEPPRAATSTEDLPESQGYDADVADRLAEDGGTVPLADEERGGL
jgi:hypothetical protein